MALSVISAASTAEPRRSSATVNASSGATGFDNLLASAAVAASNRRLSATSTSSSSSSSTTSSLPYTNNNKAQSSQQAAQDLRVLPHLQLPNNSRRRKAPEDYVDEHEDLEVRDGRLMCKYCSLVIGAARNPSGSANNEDNAGISRSSRIREHLQSKRHIVQRQLQLMNKNNATSGTTFTTLLPNSTAVDLLTNKQPFLEMSVSGFQGLLEGAASLGGGAVGQLTSALKSAACVIDAEISDIDERISQLQTQIDQLRAKKAKLAGHKSEINRSLINVTSTTVAPMPSTQSTPSLSKRTASPLPNNSLLPTLASSFGQIRTPGDILQGLTSPFVSPQFSSTAFSAILAESASALMSMVASQQQQPQQRQQGKPLHSLISSVIDASQAEDSSLQEAPLKQVSEPDSGNVSGDDNGLLCLSLAAAVATPQPTDTASSSGGNNSSSGGNRRKTLKPTRLLAARHQHLDTNDGSPSTTPTDLSFQVADDHVSNNNNRLLSVQTPHDEESPLLVKYEQRDQSVFPSASGVHSPFTSNVADDVKEAEVDRPATPEIQQYNPALADKRFRGKAVQYCLLRRFTDHEYYSNWIRLQKVTRDKRTDTETGVKDFFRCPYARKIGWQPCPYRMYALFRPDAPGQITVFRSEVDHYHAQLPSSNEKIQDSQNVGASNNQCGETNAATEHAVSSSNSSHTEAVEPCD